MNILKKATQVLGICFFAFLMVKTYDVYSKQAAETPMSLGKETYTLIATPYFFTDDSGKPSTTLVAGSMVFLHHKYNRSKACAVTIENIIYSSADLSVYYYPSFSNWSEAGTFVNNEIITIPNLPAGHYHFMRKAIAYCEDSTVPHFTKNFDIEIDIVAPSK